jgi:hypothetical protein
MVPTAIRRWIRGFGAAELRRYIAGRFFRCGEVAEWLKALAWKACIRETVSWVRIPPSPPPDNRIAAVNQLNVDFAGLIRIKTYNKTYNISNNIFPPYYIPHMVDGDGRLSSQA